jgi:hypothetical protein
MMAAIVRSSLDWLLASIPLAILLERTGQEPPAMALMRYFLPDAGR